jgi:predicted ATPase
METRAASYTRASLYRPLIDLLKAYLQIEDGDDAPMIREKLARQIEALGAALEPIQPALLCLLEVSVEDPAWSALDPRQRRQRTIDAIKQLLLRETLAAPLLIVCEDAHWLDSETQAVLDELVNGLPAARLLLLVTYRPEYQHGWGSKSVYTQLRLDPLPPTSAGELLHNLLGDDAGLEPLKNLLLRRTQGNPFFMEESIQGLVETHALLGDRGAYRLAPHVGEDPRGLPQMGNHRRLFLQDDIRIPSTVEAVLAARIDRLSAKPRRLLQTAAVVGNEVPMSLLQSVAEVSEEVLHQGLAQLQTTEFLYELNLFPDLRYAFKHALTQGAAYQSLPRHTRQSLHQRLAQVLEERFPEIVASQPEVVAHHYTEGGLIAQAIPHWQRAGQRAIEHAAHVDAIDHLTKGLELLSALPDTVERSQQELFLQTTLGLALVMMRGYAAPEVRDAY